MTNKNNASVVTVDGTGLLNGISAGIAVITVKPVQFPAIPPLTLVVTCAV